MQLTTMDDATALTDPATEAPATEVLAADARELHHVLEELMRVVQFRDRDRICCHDVSVTQCYALRAVVFLADKPAQLSTMVHELTHALDDQGNLHLLWMERSDLNAPSRLWYSRGAPR